MDKEERLIDDRPNGESPSREKIATLPQRRFAFLYSLRNGRLQRRFWRRAKLTWKIVSSFCLSAAAVTAVLYAGLLLYVRITEHMMEISPISVPKDLNDQGYTSVVVAERLRDAVKEFIVDPQSQAGDTFWTQQFEPIALKGEQPDITVPSLGLSIDTIVASMASHFNKNNVQTCYGEIVQRNGKFFLTLRIYQVGIVANASVDRNNPDKLFALAAPMIIKKLERLEPNFFIASVHG